MSLILKGIDLPTDRKPYGIEVIYRFEGADGLFSEKNYLSPNQAIQIPKGHGRLIDADETRTQYYQTMDELLQSTTINISAEALSLLCGFTLINNAPTILEAEEYDE